MSAVVPDRGPRCQTMNARPRKANSRRPPTATIGPSEPPVWRRVTDPLGSLAKGSVSGGRVSSAAPPEDLAPDGSGLPDGNGASWASPPPVGSKVTQPTFGK